MEIRFSPNRIVEIDDARLVYRNFRGEGSRFNREGERNFSVIIPNDEIANALMNEGFNVKIKPPMEEGEDPFMHLKVKVNFNDRGPIVWLVSGNRRVRLDEDSVRRLDSIDIRSVNLDIQRGREKWEINGQSGYAAYLRSIEVIQEIDRFSARFAEEEHPEE